MWFVHSNINKLHIVGITLFSLPVVLLVLFKVNAFSFKQKIKVIFSNRSQLLLYVARRSLFLLFLHNESITLTKI